MNETIKVGDQELEIPTSKLTLVFGPEGQTDIEYPDRVVVTPSKAIEHIEWCEKWHEDTPSSVCGREGIFPDTPEWGISPKTIGTMSLAIKSATGFVDIGLKLRDMKVPFMFRHPETHLHPSTQAEFASFIARELSGMVKSV